jgi:hypothetical protein
MRSVFTFALRGKCDDLSEQLAQQQAEGSDAFILFLAAPRAPKWSKMENSSSALLETVCKIAAERHFEMKLPVHISLRTASELSRTCLTFLGYVFGIFLRADFVFSCETISVFTEVGIRF